eukprot:792785-Amphidinium_carterae.1
MMPAQMDYRGNDLCPPRRLQTMASVHAQSESTKITPEALHLSLSTKVGSVDSTTSAITLLVTVRALTVAGGSGCIGLMAVPTSVYFGLLLLTALALLLEHRYIRSPQTRPERSILQKMLS